MKKALIIFLPLFLLITSLSNLYFIRLSEKSGSEFNKVTDTKNKIKIVNASPTVIPVRSVKLMLLGDIMLGRSVNMRSLDMGNVNYPFEKVADRLKKADIVFANLESPIVENCPIIEHGYTFCANPKMTESMVFSGIDIVSVANNHNMNFGKKGYEDTKKFLSRSGIKYVGDANLEIMEKNGLKFGFLGFDKSQQSSPLLAKDELDLIKTADLKVDMLVVSMHWGVEYQDKALPGVRNLAKELIKAGADVVSGNHPHWVQDYSYFQNGVVSPVTPLEWNKEIKPVYYSLGNFVFDQMWSEETKKGLAIELTFEGGQITKEEKLPTYMPEWAQPEWVN